MVIEKLGWRMYLNSTGLVGLVIGLLTFFLVREPAREVKPVKVGAEPVQETSLKDAMLNVFKNPLSRYVTLAGAFRHICNFTTDYFMPLFFIQ